MTELGQVPPVGTLRHRPPMGTTCRHPSVLPPFFPRIIEFRTILSLLPSPSTPAQPFLRTPFLEKARCWWRVSSSCSRWEPWPSIERSLEPRMRDRIVISLDGLEEEIVSSKGVVRRDIKILKLKGKGERDFFSPTVRLNYGDGGDV